MIRMVALNWMTKPVYDFISKTGFFIALKTHVIEIWATGSGSRYASTLLLPAIDELAKSDIW